MPITEINFTTWQNNILFRSYFDNSIYRISNGLATEIITFDFAEYNFPKNVLNTSQMEVFKALTSKSNLFISKVLENEKWIYVYLTQEGVEFKQYHLIISKEKDEIHMFERDMESESDFGIGSGAFLSNKNELVFVADPVSVKSFLEKRGENQLINSFNHLLNEDGNHLMLKISLD
jgi:hypothetical protein